VPDINVDSPRPLDEVRIRMWMRDNDPEANLLLEDYEFSSEEIAEARQMAVDEWNEMLPPCAPHTVESFPYRFNLLQATTANLLFIASHRFRRNQLNVQVGGGASDDQNKEGPYLAASDRLRQAWQSWAKMRKHSLNADLGWGSE